MLLEAQRGYEKYLSQWKRQHTSRLVPFYLIFTNWAENSRMLKFIHTKRAGHRMRQAGFKPATAPTPLVWIASQKGIKKINSQFTHTQTSSIHTTQVVQFLLAPILRNDGTKQFFDHCLPPRKHILGTKGIKLHTRRLSFFAYHVSFRFTHTHMTTKESLL